MATIRENKTIVLYAVVFTSFVIPFLSAAINVALPDIARQFSLNAVTLSWIAMSFLLSSSVFLVPFGKLADLLGRKRIFICGNIIVGITSLLCGLSISEGMLIGVRIIQGIGGAMMYATGMAIITHIFPPNERGKVLGINVAAVYLGLSVAPVAGGFLTQLWGWRSIFFVLVPFEIAITIASAVFIKPDGTKNRLEAFDFKGSAIYMLAISALMYGFSRLPDTNAIILSITGVALLLWFIRVELHCGMPVMEIGLFRDNRIFAFSNLSAFINYAATFAVAFILSLYLQYIKGMTPQDTGLLLISQPVVMMIMATIAGRLSDKYDPRILSSIGMSIIVAGLLMLSFISEDTSRTFLIISLVVLGAGFGLFSSPNTNSVMGSVSKQYLGIASATIGTMRLTGQMMSLGLATLMIHLFIGESHITPAQHPAFVTCVRLLFAIFAILCFIGVFASLARGKKNS
ncbi:MFS transporter [Paludibacter jiangxiensis]|uniref:Drug resistance transporter, EmrB/QacA subfamily n=1 Tax=Paludibacter jiangxiensis TaxID=681398 RepID=A0A170YR02_9BACT|nr:MFS transporter [Paludibacter jiangxiensis]GAT61991.1 drug resistance transporter, EmrB/QacA subfamily [Paludibacter jiangxiensis]